MTKRPKPRTIELASADYQPSKAEMEKEYDMPGASREEIRGAFFSPVKIVRKNRRR